MTEPIPVLNDGFVRVVDRMGSDQAVAQAARVSYGAGTKTVQEDRQLIRYLMRHEHWSPFEMAAIKIHVRVPLFVWQQWLRHRTAAVNQESLRYSEAKESFFRLGPTEWRKPDKENRQSSSGLLPVETGRELSDIQQAGQTRAWNEYLEVLDAGVSRELARVDLPVSLYTEAYWMVNLRNLLHFLRLRMDPHAQAEIRQYANAIGSIVEQWVPWTWEAFCDFDLGAVKLSRLELAVMFALSRDRNPEEACGIAREAGWLEELADGVLRRSRERQDCEAKLALFGYPVPWRGMSA